jgi:hypothetical protein
MNGPDRRFIEVPVNLKGAAMRNLAAGLVAAASFTCGSQAPSQEHLLSPAPSSPVIVGGGSGRVLLADLDGDGHLDLITQHILSSRVSLLAGDGRGHFAPFAGAPSGLGYQPGAIAIGDLDRDGIPDLGVATRDGDSEYVHVLRGDGRGRFAPFPGSPYAASASARTYKPSLQFLDVNEDENLDIVAANGRRDTIEIFFGDGPGRFAPASVVKLEPGYDNYSHALGAVS